jgi:hypothetical protein
MGGIVAEIGMERANISDNLPTVKIFAVRLGSETLLEICVTNF